MKKQQLHSSQGFSLIELTISMTIVLILLGIVSGFISQSLKTRTTENRVSDAMSVSQRALNLMSREIANSGYGLTTNGIVLADSNAATVHFRANVNNSNAIATDLSEDVTFTYDSTNKRIVRYDKYPSAVTSILATNVSDMTIGYQDYITNTNGSVTIGAISGTPTINTAKITITIRTAVNSLNGNTTQTATVMNQISIRNSKYVLGTF